MTKKKDVIEQPDADVEVAASVTALEAVPESCEMALKTLQGDLRDALLEVFKHRPKPWSACSETEQRDIAYGLEDISEKLVAKAARIIASKGFEAVSATLESVTIKEGLKITAKAVFSTHAIEMLAGAQGGEILIVNCDAGRMMHQRAPVKIDKDQPELIESDEGDPVNAGDGLSIGEQAAADFEADNAQAEYDGPQLAAAE
ncbi:MAG: hypothetical protein U5K75_11125 [Ahrensia sp.]|nr:hypothetical protein [Ahrensia sp.]